MLHRVIASLRRGGPSVPGSLKDELARLEREMEDATLDYVALLNSRAGDLCAGAGESDRALRYYGNAIDAFLDVGYYDSAAATCRRVIELSPAVVRARGTLAFLALGEGLQYLPFHGRLEENARRSIGEYVEAARRAGVEDLVMRRLAIMAEVTDNPQVREMIGSYLLELGDAEAADRVLGDVYAERNKVGKPREGDQRKRWARALQASVLTGEG